jgi:tetratricopeptide (TPR) repeat protein
VSTSASAAASRRKVLERYAHLRDDHLRFMEKWGLVHAPSGAVGEVVYSFADLATIRQAEAELATGTSFRSVLRGLLASRTGQLAFDFRIEAPAAKILHLRRPEPLPLAVFMDAPAPALQSSAEEYFQTASLMDDGDPVQFAEALAAYRRALEIDPYLVPAVINLANLHYGQDQIAEAQALYERAVALDPTVFEAHFNLGNIFHDLGRYAEAQACYREALRLNPTFADAHFYLAVTLEKHGRSAEARQHWRSYRQLAPNGEWVHLAKEFSDNG